MKKKVPQVGTEPSSPAYKSNALPPTNNCYPHESIKFNTLMLVVLCFLLKYCCQRSLVPLEVWLPLKLRNTKFRSLCIFFG